MGFDRKGNTENVRNMVTFSSYRVDMYVLQNKLNVCMMEDQVYRELICNGTTTYKRFQELSFKMLSA